VEPNARLALARLAFDAALAVKGVAGVDSGAGGARGTFAGGERVPGVVCAAVPGGVYGVELYLVARPVPLHPLAERVREGVQENARRAGLGVLLGPIDVAFEDLVDSGSSEAA
jgi:hypothetical protein